MNTPMPSRIPSWQDYPVSVIQGAFTLARAGKAPSIDVERCIKTSGASRFLQIFWREMLNASANEIEICQRLATFVLTTPRRLGRDSPPLLPLFLHYIVPTLIPGIDAQHTKSVDLLVGLISSALTAGLHLEAALQSSYIFGQPCTSMARRLITFLRTSQHQTSQVLLHRLSSSQAFAVFKSELS